MRAQASESDMFDGEGEDRSGSKSANGGAGLPARPIDRRHMSSTRYVEGA